MALDDVRAAFLAGPLYLDTTNYGLLPHLAVQEMRQALDDLSGGTFDTGTRNTALADARRSYAAIMKVDARHIATAASAAEFVGLVASSLPDGSTVLLAENDFTSLTLPFVVHKDRLDVVEVPLEAFVESVDDSIDIAAVSAAQSGDGTVVDLDALATARAAHGTRVLVDATQAASWLPIDAARYDVVLAAAYKWLLCPRGTAFAYFGDRMLGSVKPIYANWFAAEDVHTGYYGTDVPLAVSARRFDLSPSGVNWIGARPAMSLLARCGVAAINHHNVSLANRFREGIGLPASNSAIVSTAITRENIARLRARGIAFGVQQGKRAGYGRFAFHLYNTTDDVDAAVEALR